MSSNISVATWDLQPTNERPAENILQMATITRDLDIESVLPMDKRTLVNPDYIKPGGKYYSIVKLQIRYDRQDKDDTRYAQGTGWLITPDLLVTAGHLVYDHLYGFGRATEVKVYVGYHGKESVHMDSYVQFRRGIKIATSKNWVQSEVNRADDISFIRVENPFENINPIRWEQTPTKGDFPLAIVGYPGDKRRRNEEAGAEMYEESAQTRFDLKTTTSNMLEHQLSTYAGQDGSPVLVQERPNLTSIGIHVYGLGARNSASVFRGEYGNDFEAYRSVFDVNDFKTISEVNGVKYLNVPRRAE